MSHNEYKLNHQRSKSKQHVDNHNQAIGGQLKLLKAVKAPVFPASFSLSSKYTLDVLDQGNLGSCTANAFCAIMSSLRKGKYSRLYTYFNTRVATGNSPTDDSGVDLLQALPYFASYGLVPETNWPYDINKFSTMPPMATTYKVADTTTPITLTAIPQTVSDIQNALYSGKFVMLGISVYSSCMTSQVASSGLIPLPNLKTDRLLGGHCVHLVGWMTVNGTLYFIARNSWGKNWGNDGSISPKIPFSFKNNGSNGGFCYIPSAYLLNTSLAFEFISVV